MRNILLNIIYKLLTLPLCKYNKSPQLLPEHNKKGIVSPRIFSYIDNEKKKQLGMFWVDNFYKPLPNHYIKLSFFNSLIKSYQWHIRWKFKKYNFTLFSDIKYKIKYYLNYKKYKEFDKAVREVMLKTYNQNSSNNVMK